MRGGRAVETAAGMAGAGRGRAALRAGDFFSALEDIVPGAEFLRALRVWSHLVTAVDDVQTAAREIAFCPANTLCPCKDNELSCFVKGKALKKKCLKLFD